MLPGHFAPAIFYGATVIFSAFWKTAQWRPATKDSGGRHLFSHEVVLQLCLIRLADLECENVTEKSASGVESWRDVMKTPELRLAYELIPEIVAEYILTTISAPEAHKYVLSDQKGRSHLFDCAEHPAYEPVHAILAQGTILEDAAREIARSAAYADAVSKALNAGEKLSDLTICCAPIGLLIRRGKLEIKPGCEID